MLHSVSMKLLVLAVVLLASSTKQSFGTNHKPVPTPDAKILYVRPENSPNSTCPGLPCETLDHYANVSHSNNTRFLFLPGSHRLRKSFRLRQMQSIQFVGVEANGTFIAEKHDRPRIQCNVTDSPAGFIFESVDFLIIQNLDISSCGQVIPTSVYSYNISIPVQAAVALKQVYALTIHSVTIQHSHGYGLAVEELYGNSSIVECLFVNNTGTIHYVGGNLAIRYKRCPAKYTSTQNHISITKSQFLYGNTTYVSKKAFSTTESKATGIVLILSCTNISVYISNVDLSFNEAYSYSSKGGNLYVTFKNKTHYTQSSVTVEDSNISNGNAIIGGGVYIRYKTLRKYEINPCRNTIIFKNTNFTGNHGRERGGAMYILFEKSSMYNCCPNGSVTIENCFFEDNVLTTSTTDAGVAINIFSYSLNGVVATAFPLYYVIIKHSHFSRNTLLARDSGSRVSGGAVVYIEKHRRETVIIDSTFEDNCVTAISAFRSNIIFEGDVLIKNNTGIDGGGLVLCEGSYILFSPNTNVIFESNKAYHSGGGIYAQSQCLQSQPLCFYQVYGANFQENQCSTSGTPPANISTLDTIHVKMINNTAVYAGSQIYGGSMDYCHSTIHNNSTIVYNKIFNEAEWQFNRTSDLSYKTSDPRFICFCDNNNNSICDNTTLELDRPKYPGESFEVGLVAVGQFNQPVPASIVAGVDTTELLAKTIPAQCTTIKFNAYNFDNPTEMRITLLVSSNEGFSRKSKTKEQTSLIGRYPRFIYVHLRQCPLGTHLNKECSFFFHSNKYLAKNQTISRQGNTWLGYHFASNHPNDDTIDSYVGLDHCPLGYCNPNRIYIKVNETFFDQNSQCAIHREGTLCGSCSPPYSLAMASSTCILCENYTKTYLILVAMGFFAASIIVLSLLICCNLTITEGTVSGFLFYTNLYSTNRSIYLRTHEIFQSYVISWVNLDVGLKACFYYGFDAFGQTVLAFFMPTFMWIVAGLVIYISSKSTTIATLVGKNAVKVLATLIYLSYTKILQAEVATFSCASIGYPTANNTIIHKYWWLKDGNVPCWQGKHLVLVVIGSLFVVLTVLYALVLLFIQPLQRYSHLRGLRWVFRIKPFIDAHTCPHVIKDRYRFWMGLLLLVRMLCMIGFALTSYRDEPHNIMLVVIFACIFIFTLTSSLGGIYKHWWLNVLNSSFYLNLISLSIATFYFLIKPNQVQANYGQNIVTQVSLGFAVLTLGLILIYHVVKRLRELDVCNRCVRIARFWQAILARYRDWREQRYQRVPQEEGEENDRELQDEFDGEREIESDRESDDSNNRDREPLLSVDTY